MLDRPEYVGSTLSYGDVDDVLLVCHGTDAAAECDWQMLLQRLAVTDYRVLLISTAGGGPSHDQRHALSQALLEGERHPPRIAVLSASPRMRWLNAALRFMSDEDVVTLRYDAMDAALRFLECAPTLERMEAARLRAHYMLEKRAVEHGPALGERGMGSARSGSPS